MRPIDADVLRKSVNGVSTHWLNDWSTLGVLAMIDKQPTVDAVPVVRCKDCLYRHNSIMCRMYSEGMDTPDNWFCADGKEKEK